MKTSRLATRCQSYRSRETASSTWLIAVKLPHGSGNRAGGVEHDRKADVQALVGHDRHLVYLRDVVRLVDDRRRQQVRIGDQLPDASTPVVAVDLVGAQDQLRVGPLQEVRAGRQPYRPAPVGADLDRGEELLRVLVVGQVGRVLARNRRHVDHRPVEAIGRDGRVPCQASVGEQGLVPPVGVFVALVPDDLREPLAARIDRDVVVPRAPPLVQAQRRRVPVDAVLGRRVVRRVLLGLEAPALRRRRVAAAVKPLPNALVGVPLRRIGRLQRHLAARAVGPQHGPDPVRLVQHPPQPVAPVDGDVVQEKLPVPVRIDHGGSGHGIPSCAPFGHP